MVQGVTITRGASDELSETQPGTCTMTLDNADGALTPGNPNSPYYPYVRKNSPIRVSMAVMPTTVGAAPWPLSQMGDTFDSTSGLWSTFSGGAAVVGGRARIPLTPGVTSVMSSARQWTLPGASICARLATVPTPNGSAVSRSNFFVESTTAGTRLGFQHNVSTGKLRAVNLVGDVDGSPADVDFSPIDHRWMRIREASGLVRWETSPDGWDWTTRRTLATPAWVTSQSLVVSFNAVRTGGTGDYAEWDLLGAQVRPRFYGMVNEWPVQWDGLYSKAQISATDLFKRVNKLPTLRSMLGMEVLTVDTLTGTFSFPAAYFPLSEPAGAASAGSVAGSGIGALAVTQIGVGGTLEFGDEGVPETGESCPTFAPVTGSAGQYLVGDMGPQFAADSSTWLEHIQVWIKTSTAGRAIMGMHDQTQDHQLVLALNGSGILTLETTQTGTPLTITTTASGNLANGEWHHIVYDGSAKQIYIDGSPVGGSLLATSTQDIRTLYVAGYRDGRLWNGQIAHLSIHLANGPVGSVYAVSYDAITGFAGESADWRIERLARYAGLSSVTLFGMTHDPIASQGPAGSSVMARLREVESTESGRLYAERDYFGLAYQSRDLRFNPDTVGEVFEIAYADLEPGIQLADDDQKLVNEVEASRPGGATQTVQAAASILAFGTYPQQLNILKTSDNAVTDAASWRVMRYANPEAELREVPIQAHTMPEYLDILDADISSYFTVYDLPEQATATEIRSTVEGYAETIKEQSHFIQFRTSTATQDSVWVIGDPVYGVLGVTSRLAY